VAGDKTTLHISPDGQRVVVGARGDVFSVPAKHGPTRNLTATPGVHERDAQWSPDGKWIAYISDRSGEDEIYMQPQAGGQAVRLTRNSSNYKYAISWAPDSQKIMWADRNQRLYYVDVASKKTIRVAQANAFEIRQYAWSPDSQWIAYARPEVESMQRVYLYSLRNKRSTAVTSGWYNSAQPAFSADGKFLFFTSTRDLNPTFSQVEFNFSYQDLSRIYLLTLAKSTLSPVGPQSDEVDLEKKDEKKDDKEKKDKKKNIQVRVDLDGLAARIDVLPIKASSYFNLSSVDDRLFYSRNGSRDEKPVLLMYDFKKRKETEFGQVDNYVISADQKKMLVIQKEAQAVLDLPKAKIKMEDKLDLSKMYANVDRRAEWAQIFNECWRQMRDFFYVPNMHGVDWKKMRQKYEPLVKYVSHRADLTYVIGEMISELNVGHSYVGGGDMEKADRVPMGLLGARLKRDERSGTYRITKILKGRNWSKTLRSPLTEIGVNVKEGDYIIAVSGRPTRELSNIYQALINKADQQVVLSVNAKPSAKGARDVIVKPIADEHGLYYLNWVKTNMEKVNRRTHGKVGYIHVPDMGPGGLNEFVENFYPQLRKKALIIDVRGNGGGFVSPLLIERLRRQIAMLTFGRNTAPNTNPNAMIWGPKICLTDEFAASDGDLFSYRFRKHKLGKLVGKRTWGGVVGIRNPLPLLDGGKLFKPEFSRYDVNGKKWIIEGVGVAPDIEVENDPARVFMGKDDQLDRAIKEIMQDLKTQEKTIPPIPPYLKR
jgi:tricorn protease